MLITNVKAYAVIHDLERALRAFISSTLGAQIGDGWWDLAPQLIIDRAAGRKAADQLEQGSDIEIDDDIEYTDLTDLWEILRNRDFRDFFDPSMPAQLAAADDVVSKIKSYRDTVMHNRVLTTAGLDDLVDSVRNLGSKVPILELGFATDLDRIERDELHQTLKWNELRGARRLAKPGRELNNLPAPDFDDFIGRRKQLEEVSKRLRSKYFPIVSIDGVGGVGKSALAYTAAERVWHSPEHRFTALVYLSAKSTKLTTGGLASIAPTLTTYESVLDAIISVTSGDDGLDYKLEKKDELVAGLLSSEPILLILDNLEAVTDERVIQLILEWEYPGKVLITSRRRLGEIERVIHLPEMPDQEAMALARHVARSASLVSLAKAPDEDVKRLVRRAGNIPLAIKWTVGKAALGQSLEEVTREVDQPESEILEFCFREVVDGLSADALKILTCMPLFFETPTQGEIVAATGLDRDRFSRAMQEELVLSSLVAPVIRSGESGEPETAYSTLPLTRAFAEGLLRKDRKQELEFSRRIARFRQMVSEQHVGGRRLKYSLVNVPAKTDLGRIAAFQAIAAGETYRRGDPASAREQFREAHQTDTSVAGVLLLWASMEDSQGDHRRADELMVKASEIDQDDPKTWATWGRMRKQSQDLDAAQAYFERAVSLDQEYFWSRFQLSTILSWKGEFQASLDHNEICAGIRESQDDRANYKELVSVGRAECLRRWADEIVRHGGDTEEALTKLHEALEIAQSLVGQSSDAKSELLYHEIEHCIGAAHYLSWNPDEAKKHFEAALFEPPVREKERHLNAETHWRLAQIAKAADDLDAASGHISRAVSLAKDSAWQRMRAFEMEIDQAKAGG